MVPFGLTEINNAPKRPWLEQSSWFEPRYPSYSSLGLKLNIMLITGKEKTYWGQWLTNNHIYICFELLMKTRAAGNSLASSLRWQLLPASTSRMFLPNWWPRPSPSPWQWGDIGSSAQGQSTVSLSKRLSDKPTATTWYQSGARLLSSALEVGTCPTQTACVLIRYIFKYMYL